MTVELDIDGIVAWMEKYPQHPVAVRYQAIIDICGGLTVLRRPPGGIEPDDPAFDDRFDSVVDAAYDWRDSFARKIDALLKGGMVR